MSCCGKTRRQASQNNDQNPVKSNLRQTVQFQYVGQTALTVTGPVSRTSYRFDSPGARATVDSRDYAALSGVPVLKPTGM
jgi:hypothetical protein